jgi:hypothetical protein
VDWKRALICLWLKLKSFKGILLLLLGIDRACQEEGDLHGKSRPSSK